MKYIITFRNRPLNGYYSNALEGGMKDAFLFSTKGNYIYDTKKEAQEHIDCMINDLIIFAQMSLRDLDERKIIMIDKMAKNVKSFKIIEATKKDPSLLGDCDVKELLSFLDGGLGK